jgi:hypothetical protein
MERDPKSMQPGQDALIVAHPESGGLVVHDFSKEAYVDFEERRMHELNALSLFGAINQRERFYSYLQDAAAERYGDKAKNVLEGARRNRDLMVREAEDSFYQSIGLFQVEATAYLFAGFNIDDYRRDARRQWTEFQAKYRSENRVYARNAHRRELLAGVSASDVNQEQATFNRQHNLRPHISDKDQAAAAKAGTEYPLLSTRERMVAIQDDPRAGFIPTTNREKNMIMSYLDYLDNPEYPLGITNQLFEVFIHQQKLDKPAPGDTPAKRAQKLSRQRSGLHMAIRSLESITYEMGDYLHNAQETHAALVGLQDFLKEPYNPHITIDEEVPIEDRGLRALIRFKELARYRDKDELPSDLKDPLITKEFRFRKESERTATDVGPNKVVEDVYTRGVFDGPMKSHVTAAAQTMTIREARRIIGYAVADQKSRLAFYETNLQSIIDNAPDERVLTIRQIAAEVLGKEVA